jgi:hypothetical protein
MRIFVFLHQVHVATVSSMAYTAVMSLGTGHGYPGYSQELDTLLANYGSDPFMRSMLSVYSSDCPSAIQRLRKSIAEGDLESARRAAHSLANIMGVAGPATCLPIIEDISSKLGSGQLQAAAVIADKLQNLIDAVLTSIDIWLAGRPGPAGLNTDNAGGRG